MPISARGEQMATEPPGEADAKTSAGRKEEYERNLESLKRKPGRFQVFAEPVFDGGSHPENFVDHECAFAARNIRRLAPRSILDVGSYRHFLLGLQAHFPVATVDVRNRQPLFPGETVFTGDAKRLDLPDRSFDLVLSLCTLEHLGLGRYGDDLDFEADGKAFREMVRVLKPGGHLLFSTTITRARPAIGFNAHRIYSYAMLREFCDELIPVEEMFYSHRLKTSCPLEEVTAAPQGWDVYCGCWQKP
jgi:SAM-dependent methyltransferase